MPFRIAWLEKMIPIIFDDGGTTEVHRPTHDGIWGGGSNPMFLLSREYFYFFPFFFAFLFCFPFYLFCKRFLCLRK